MEEKDKNLIEKKESIFKRLLLKIRSIFKKEELKQDENISNEDDFENSNLTEADYKEVLERMASEPYTKVPEYNYKNDIDPEAEKARVRKLYQDVKDGLVDIESLSAVDLIIVNKLLGTEVEITKKKLT